MTKSVNYYAIGNDDDMEAIVGKKGTDIVNRLTLRTNSTITTPLLD